MLRRLAAFLRAKRGTSAVEFALVVPVFLALTIGAFNLCAMVWINSVLQSATDDAARCMAVKTTICTNALTTQSHASANFVFPSLSPNFTATPTPASNCGDQVTGTATYQLNAVLVSIPIHMSAQSCFPIQTT